MRKSQAWHGAPLAPRRLVFIDETWIKTSVVPLRGRGDRGKRLITHVRHGHWQTMTFIGALHHDRIEAPSVLNGPINAEAFKTYVRAELLKILTPMTLLSSTTSSNKVKAVRVMVKAIGARPYFLPSYRPDLNPIEQAVAKIKHAMRKAMGRSVEAVERAAAETLDTSHRRNARTTSQMPDTSQPKCKTR